MSFTDTEREAFALADSRTLADVKETGGILYAKSVTLPNLADEYGIPSADEATLEDRRLKMRQALFAVAVFALGEEKVVETIVSRRASQMPVDVKPSTEELGQIIAKARVYRERCLKDLAEDRSVDAGGEPPICITDARLNEMSSAALAILNMKNDPPWLFARNGAMVRIQTDEQGLREFKTLTEAGLAGELDRMIYWHRSLKSGERPAAPPKDVIKDILALPSTEWGIPALKTITATPVFHHDGTIHETPGYDETSQLYYAPANGFVMPAVPEIPTCEDVANALALIEELFCDFAFVSAADRANAYGALLTPILRPCIEGSIPLYIVSKPQAGVGAGLLQKAISIVAEGREPSLKTMPSSDAELRKEILATLRAGTTIQVLDNITTPVASPELSAVLTTSRYTGRILGVTEDVTLNVSTAWMANGVNVQIAGDIARRSYRSQIDPEMAIPWQRPDETFKHPDLLGWARDNRGRILAAVYTLARAWIQAGRPEPRRAPPVGSYPEWRHLVAGILEHAGVEDFLANANDLYLEADSDRVQWEAFLSELAKVFRGEPFAAGRVTALLNEDGAGDGGLVDLLPDALVEAFATRRRVFTRELGREFAKIDSRHFPGGWCLKRGNVVGGSRRWVIIRSQPAPGVTDTEGEGGVGGLGGSESIPQKILEKNNFYNIDQEKIIFSKGLEKVESDPPHPPTSTELDPPPPGCLKHPIERYEKRRFDSSILCIVPGCQRHGEYGAGAGYALCEGHYQAEKRRVREVGS